MKFLSGKSSAFIAVLLIAVMIFTAGCGANENVTDETTSTVAQEETLPAEAPVSEALVTDEVTDITESTTLPEETTSETTAEALPQTIPEIVELFNKSANRIKPEASKITKNFERRIVDKDKLVVPKSLQSTADSLLDTFMKDDTDPIVYATREEINAEYLVPGQSYVSKLTADAVKSATCTDKGDTYEINIKLKDEKNPTAGKGVGSVCDVIEASEVADKASFVEEFSTSYYNCEVTVTVDKASGKVIHAVYKTPLVLKVVVNMFGTHNGEVGLTFIKDYTITY